MISWRWLSSTVRATPASGTRSTSSSFTRTICGSSRFFRIRVKISASCLPDASLNPVQSIDTVPWSGDTMLTVVTVHPPASSARAGLAETAQRRLSTIAARIIAITSPWENSRGILSPARLRISVDELSGNEEIGMTPRQAMRHLIARTGYTMVPGAYDTLTARLVEQAGFPAVYLTGGGYSRANGYPDMGLLTLGENVRFIGRTVEAVGVPVIADADTGYGNALNVIRTVREYEKAGVAAFHLEDQVSPKKCGHYEGKEVISRSGRAS